MTLFFRQKTPEPLQAKCLLRAVQLIRVHQSGLKGRAVPHFPEDLQDNLNRSQDRIQYTSNIFKLM